MIYRYGGSKPWIVFWAIIFFPIALILLFSRGKFQGEGKSYSIEYTGSLAWLGFWCVVFFPIGFLLAVLNEVRLIPDDV